MAGASPMQARRQQAAELLLGRAAVSAEPQSQLREAFEGLSAQCMEKLGQLAPVPMDITLRDLDSGASADAVAGLGASAVVASFQLPDRSAPILIGADGAFMNAALEAVLGSDGSEPASRADRAPTRIELRLAGAIFEEVADALRLAIFGTSAAPLELEKVETAENAAPTPRRDGQVTVARFELSTLERTGEMVIAVPQSSLKLGQPASLSAIAAPAGQDTRWSKRIEQEVQRTQVTLHAVLDERELTLGDIADLRVGQVLPLKATPRSNVRVVCNDQTLFWCELGQTEGIYTLRIKDFPDEEQELIDAITSQ